MNLESGLSSLSLLLVHKKNRALNRPYFKFCLTKSALHSHDNRAVIIEENKKCNNGVKNEKTEPKYYCSSSNRFWKVVVALLGGDYPPPSDNEKRKELLGTAGIALWDVYKKAVRAGALDGNIRDGQVNNFSELVQLLKENPGIHTIAFNGVKASKAFSEKIRIKLQAELKDRTLSFLSLPSTSGASRKKTDILVREWLAKLGKV